MGAPAGSVPGEACAGRLCLCGFGTRGPRGVQGIPLSLLLSIDTLSRSKLSASELEDVQCGNNGHFGDG